MFGYGCKQVGHRLLLPLACRLGVVLRHVRSLGLCAQRGGHVREDAGQLHCVWTHECGQGTLRSGAQIHAQRLHEWLVGDGRILVVSPLQPLAATAACVGAELRRQPRLADSRLPRDEHQATLALHGGIHPRSQCGDLPFPAHHRLCPPWLRRGRLDGLGWCSP